MRFLVCITLLFICLATLPSIHCQNRKSKLSEYNEKDRRDTNARYSKREEDNQRYKKLKYRGRNDDEEETTENRFKKKESRYQDDENERQYGKQVRKYKREEANDEGQRDKRYKHNKNDEEEMVKTSNRRNRVDARKLQESDEDSDEDNDSEVCISRKGKKCESTDGSDESEEKVPLKKQVTHVKKFAHEKQKSKQDREMGNILKLHKKDGRRSIEEDDDSSEETPARKRGRFIWADEDE